MARKAHGTSAMRNCDLPAQERPAINARLGPKSERTPITPATGVAMPDGYGGKEPDVSVTVETHRWHGAPEERRTITRSIRREGRTAEVTMQRGDRVARMVMDDAGEVSVYVDDGFESKLAKVVLA